MEIILFKYKKWHEVKIRDFQYIINYKILVANSFLAKIKKIDSELCIYYKEQPEKIYHLFLTCPKVRHFWNELRAWLYTNLRIDTSLADREILFSFGGKNDLVNYIYVLAMFYIYQNKFISMNISIQGFINLLKKKMLSEKYVCFINNKLNIFFKKLSPLYNYFFPLVTDE